VPPTERESPGFSHGEDVKCAPNAFPARGRAIADREGEGQIQSANLGQRQSSTSPTGVER